MAGTRRHQAILVLNQWKREGNNAEAVLTFLIEELKLREKYEVPD